MVGGSGKASASVALSYAVYVRSAAERDVAEAQKWYEEQQRGLAAEFHIEFGATLGRLAETPLIYTVLYRNVRRAVLHRFPYLVWYRVQNSSVTVLACTHGKVDPSKVPARLRKT
jgi:plasmid stabilization system protein ParE